MPFKAIHDRAERHDLKSRILLYILLFFFPKVVILSHAFLIDRWSHGSFFGICHNLFTDTVQLAIILYVPSHTQNWIGLKSGT